MTIPSPADVAERLGSLRVEPSTRATVVEVRRNYPRIVRSVERVDIDIASSIERWIESEGAASVAQWIDRQASASASCIYKAPR